VIYKPKRNRYSKLEGVNDSKMMIEPNKVKKFLESGLDGSSISWNAGKKGEWLKF